MCIRDRYAAVDYGPAATGTVTLQRTDFAAEHDDRSLGKPVKCVRAASVYSGLRRRSVRIRTTADGATAAPATTPAGSGIGAGRNRIGVELVFRGTEDDALHHSGE